MRILVGKKQSRTFFRRLRLLKRLSERQSTGPRERQNLPVFRVSWTDHVAQLREGEFKRRYRMPKTKFDFLLEQCAAIDNFFKPLSIQQQSKQKSVYDTEGIEPAHKLAETIR